MHQICIIYPQELTKVPIYLVLSLGAQHHPESWKYIYTYIENNNNNYNNNNEKKKVKKKILIIWLNTQKCHTWSAVQIVIEQKT